MSDKKVFDIKIEDGKLIISIDTNKDGEPVAFFSVALSEIPDEVIDAIKKD